MKNILLILGLACLIISCGEQKSSSSLLVGVGESVITPPNPVGVAMTGYDRKGNLSTGTHDELHSRAFFVQDKDSNRAILLTVAVVNMPESVMEAIRSLVEKETGVPFGNIIISSTHTHSGPLIGALDTVSQSFYRALADKSTAGEAGQNRDSSYVDFFIKQNVACAVAAWKDREPGKIGVGKTEIFGLAMNDRRMDHGGWAQDSIATVIKLEKADGKLKGVFVNYGCHPSALDLHNLEFTEDWPYYTIQNIKEKVGKEVVVAYVQSAQGDAKVGYTAELSAVGADMNGIRSFWFAEKKGRILGKAVNEILDSIKTEGDLSVRTFYEKYPFPRRTSYPYTHVQALKWKAEADAQLAKMEKEVGTTIGKRRLDYYKVESWLANQAVNVSKQIESNPNPQPYMMAMQGLKIGEHYFVTFPNEVFTEIGLAVKKASPHPNTIVVGLAAGYSGYIPTKAEYLEQGYASNGSPYAPECADLLVTNAAKIIEALDGN